MRDGRFYKFYVYIMGSRTGTLYVGMTGFFDKRTGEHKSGSIDGLRKSSFQCSMSGQRIQVLILLTFAFFFPM